MLLCDDTLFIHVPKVGGMSVTSWLLNNLDGQLILSVPKKAQPHTRTTLAFDDIEPRLSFLPGGRHERIDMALEKCERWNISRPKRVFVLVRPVYDLVRSYYQYVQRPNVAKRMQNQPVLAAEAALAANGALAEFAAKCTIMGKGQDELLGYYQSQFQDIQIDIIPLEFGFEYLQALFSHHENCGRMSLAHRNRAKENIDRDDNAAEIATRRFAGLEAVYQKAIKNWPSLISTI